MDNSAYQNWWQLHLRVAREETLAPEELAAYQQGLSSFEQDESLQAITDARKARQYWIALDTEYLALEQRRGQLEGEIAKLESQLSEHTRQYLGVED
jgi:cell division protein FtsB